LFVECAFFGANIAVMYQKFTMNIVKYTAILLLFVGMKCEFASWRGEQQFGVCCWLELRGNK
jgi:hypothetical protein